MNRRDILKSVAILGVPKPIHDFDTSCDGLNLYQLVAMLKQSVRFEMPSAQWTAWTLLMATGGYGENRELGPFTAGMMSALPIAVNERVPKDEVWLVGHDGTVISKLLHLAVPTMFDR